MFHYGPSTRRPPAPKLPFAYRAWYVKNRIDGNLAGGTIHQAVRPGYEKVSRQVQSAELPAASSAAMNQYTDRHMRRRSPDLGQLFDPKRFRFRF